MTSVQVITSSSRCVSAWSLIMKALRRTRAPSFDSVAFSLPLHFGLAVAAASGKAKKASAWFFPSSRLFNLAMNLLPLAGFFSTFFLFVFKYPSARSRNAKAAGFRPVATPAGGPGESSGPIGRRRSRLSVRRRRAATCVPSAPVCSQLASRLNPGSPNSFDAPF